MRFMFKIRTMIFSALLVFLIAGCNPVTTLYPLGAPLIPEDKDNFEGSWLKDNDSVISIRFTSNGVGHIAAPFWENDQFRLVQMELIVTKNKDKKFISVRIKERETWDNYYYFAQYDFSDKGELILWEPNIEAFEAAIKTRNLEGVDKNSGINITNPPGVLLKFLNDNDNQTLFKYRNPIVLRKIGK